MNRRILLVGATGVFGSRLASHLSRFEGLDLVLTSRSADKAAGLAHRLANSPNIRSIVTGMALNRDDNLERLLAEIAPWLVIDASGPFQGLDYRLAGAAICAGAHYLDLADARDYLAGFFPALDDLAKLHGVVAISGTSSTPALSSAAVAALAGGWKRIDTINIAITPGGKSEVGVAVIAAILSYAGKPVPIFENGRAGQVNGWTGSKEMEMPGLGTRRVAPVETADAEMLPAHFNVSSTVRFYAGLESSVEQWGLICLAHLRRLGLFDRPDWLVPLLRQVRRLTALTTGDRGGMLVEVSGLDAEGRPVKARWSLLAENGQGTYVPVLPTAAAVRALAGGRMMPGARACIAVLSLAEIEAEMRPYAITTKMEQIYPSMT
jgi:saccharopine dehydrogenase-like NADP-dependent oxidoreductase